MNTRPLALVDKYQFWKEKTYYSEYLLRDDLTRLKKLYQQNGFMAPEIGFRLTPRKQTKKAALTINITEGRPIVIGEINYYNTRDTNLTETQPTTPIIPLKTTQRFCDANVVASQKTILDFYRDNGYPHASVRHQLILKEDLHLADVVFYINAGRMSYFGPINLQGDSLISRSYINKHIGLQQGDKYSQAKLDKTQQDLFDTGLFQYITIKTKTDNANQAQVPVLIQVKEMPRWAFKIGVGYGTEDKVRISFLLSRLNFLGGGRTFIVKGQHSFFVPLSLEAKFIQPHLWQKKLALIVNPLISKEHEDSYDVERVGTAITLQQEVSKKTSAYISYNLGIDKVRLTNGTSPTADKTPISTQNNKSGLTLGFKHNTSNNPLYPSKGWEFNTLLTYMGLGFNSQFHYIKVITEFVRYIPIGEQLVLACKLKGGIMEPVRANENTPIEDRFLMGGALSLRGWGRNQISPTNSLGYKIGGNAMLESSAELRFPVHGDLSGATFIDFGNTWENAWENNIHDMLYNLGVGLRYKSPVGPVRLDLATPIIDTKWKARLFITIGHAF